MKKQLFPALAVGLLLNLFVALSAALAVDRINVTNYGATPNDGTNDTTAINAAVSAGRSIYFPPGTYNYTGLLYVPANQSYRFYGDGPGVSTIIFTGNSSGGGTTPFSNTSIAAPAISMSRSRSSVLMSSISCVSKPRGKAR